MRRDRIRAIGPLSSGRHVPSLVLGLFFLNIFLWIPLVEEQYGIPLLLKYIISFSFISAFVLYRIDNGIGDSSTPAVLKFVIVLFFVWSTWLLLTSFRYELLYVQELFAARYYFIPFLLPLLIFNARFSVSFFKTLLKYSYVLVWFAILIGVVLIASGLDRVNWYENMHRIWIFDLGASLLLLSSHLLRWKWVSVAAFVYFILLVFISAYFGSRSILLECCLFLFFAVLIRFRSSFFNAFSKVVLTAIVFITVLLIFFSITYWQERLFVFEKGFGQESFDDSRGVVFSDFFYDFDSEEDWIFGRGLNGTVLRTINHGSKYGNVIENGFLFIILKGGLLYLIPMIILFFWSAYLGFFRSKNDFAKALAVLPVVYVLVMFAFNLPDASSKYLLVWIAVVVNLHGGLRELTNQTLYIMFNCNVRRYGSKLPASV